MSQNQINLYDRMQTCICVSASVGIVLVYSMCLPKALIPGAYFGIREKKIQSLQTLPMDATSHEKANHMDRQKQVQHVGRKHRQTLILNQE